MEHLIQGAILLFSAAAVILLTAGSRRVQLAGCLAGLVGQPLWFYTTWLNGQWGIFALCLVYACFYIRGVWVRMKDPRKPFEEHLL